MTGAPPEGDDDATMSSFNISSQVQQALTEMLEVPVLERGQILVVGCSTSEIKGHQIGSAGDLEIAAMVLHPILDVSKEIGFRVAIQCCEHLNRALVVEQSLARELDLPLATVIPTPSAGGAMGALAMEHLDSPVVCEDIKAHAGLDIGHTLVGMHIRPVAVPLRLSVSRVGQACLVAAASRPRLIGGERSQYPADRWGRGVC